VKPKLKGFDDFWGALLLIERFGIRVKCFSIVPCNLTLTLNKTENKIGSCTPNDQFRVIEFKHVDDYMAIMSKLSVNDLKLTRHLLETKLDKFIPYKPKRIKYLRECINDTFLNFKLKYAENFSKRFLNSSKI